MQKYFKTRFFKIKKPEENSGNNLVKIIVSTISFM